jgi:tight adherence protein B
MAAYLLPMGLVFAFASVVLLVQTSAGLLFAERDRTARVNRRLAMYEAGLTREQIYSRLTRGPGRGASAAAYRFLQPRLRRALQLAGVTLSIPRFLILLGSIAGALWLLSAFAWARVPGSGLLPNALLALAASTMLTGLGAWMWLGRRQRARLKKIELQMPIALDVMTRALRAGHPVVSANHMAAEEMGDPLGSEFGLVLDETTYGVELHEALSNFAERSGSPDAYYLAVSIAVQTETGGNLSEILEGLAIVIRGRTSLTQKVKALSSEGRTSALILTALPVLVIGVQLLLQPQVYTDKFSDPIFWPAVGFTMGLYFAGWLVIRRIINFKY